MTVIKINAITVPEGIGSEVTSRFAVRAGAVDGTEGFEGFELWEPEDGRKQWLVVTRWLDDASFEKWRSSGEAADAHKPVEGATEKPLNLSAELWQYTVSVASQESD
ncbi:antibiotic biosynthesis monooxygenase [bacterium]|nr:antibiotic biosynthesis monooxygenase [bacterium]